MVELLYTALMNVFTLSVKNPISTPLLLYIIYLFYSESDLSLGCLNKGLHCAWPGDVNSTSTNHSCKYSPC